MKIGKEEECVTSLHVLIGLWNMTNIANNKLEFC